MKKRLTFCAAILMSSATAQAATLFDDDFAAEVASATGTVATINFTALENWDIIGGAVDLLTNGGFGLPCGSTGCLDLDGSVRDGVQMETKTAFSFTAGTTYNLALDFAGRNGGGAETITFGLSAGVRILNFAPADATDVTETLSFTAATDFSSTLFIESAGGDNFGMLLDRVTLSSDAAPVVPLPASSLLLGAGIGALAWRARKRAS
jgi:hypothetical protein